MRNNKGQTLVIFVIILPLIAFLLTLVINEGSIYLQKRTLENEVRGAIKYRFELDDETENIREKIEKYLYKNITNIKKLNINIDSNYIQINIETTLKEELPSMIKSDNLNTEITYIGYIDNGEIIIEKE